MRAAGTRMSLARLLHEVVAAPNAPYVDAPRDPWLIVRLLELLEHDAVLGRIANEVV